MCLNSHSDIDKPDTLDLHDLRGWGGVVGIGDTPHGQPTSGLKLTKLSNSGSRSSSTLEIFFFQK